MNPKFVFWERDNLCKVIQDLQVHSFVIFQSKDKTYPRLTDCFFDEEDFLAHKPAVRIVDQRNLYNETKLKLYRDRPKNKDVGPSSMEKKFRMMLEQEKSMTSKSSRSSRQTT